MLEPKTQEIPLRFGLDTSEDDEGVRQGATELVNYDFVREGAARRRHGFVKLNNTDLGPSTNTAADYVGFIQAGSKLGLLRAGALDVASASVTPNTVLNFPTTFDHQTFGTFAQGRRVQSTDALKLTHGGVDYLVLAYTNMTEATGEELTGTPSYFTTVQFIDTRTGAIVGSGSASGYGGKLALVKSGSNYRVVLFYIDSTTLKAYTFTPGTWAQSGSPISCATIDIISNVVSYDVTYVSDNTFGYVAYVASGNMTIGKFDYASIVTVTPFSVASRATGNAVTGPFAITVLASGSVAVARRGTTRLFAEVFPASLASQTTTQQLDSSALTYRNVTLVERAGTGAGTIEVYGDSTTGTLYHYQTYAVGGLLAMPSTANTALMSKAWAYAAASGAQFVYVAAAPANADTTEYRTVMVLGHAGTSDVMVGQVSYDEAGPANGVYFNSAALPAVPAETSSRFFLPALADLETADANALASDKRVRRVRVSRIDFTLARVVSTVTLGGVGFASGSIPSAFDGVRRLSASFAEGPSAPSASAGGAGALTGTYSYKVVLEYTDANGNLQVSPPSPAASVTVSAKQINLSYTVQPHLLYAQQDVRVKFYRNTAGGPIYYLVHTYVATASAGTTVTVSDNVTDATIVSAETVYTTGSVLESEPVPPLRHLCAHRNRLFGLRSDTPRTIAFTKETFEPFMPQWNSSLTHRVDNEGGDPTALGSLADMLVVFQADQINVIFGQGPSAVSGDTTAFSQPETIHRGVGVSDAARGSVVSTPMGLMFAHSSGIHLLTPDRQVLPLGVPVLDEIGSDTVFRGRYMPSRHQVWFLLRTSAGTTQSKILAYDVRFKRWLTWTTPAAFEDVIEHNGTCYALSRSDLYKYDTTTWLDAGATPLFAQTVGLPWFRGDRSQELRLWKVLVTGRKESGQNAEVTVALQVYTQNARNDKSSTAADNTYTWSSTITSAVADNFLLAARVVTQRCRAFRCRLTLTPVTSDADSPYLTLSAFTYDYGVTPTRSKTPKGRRPVIS